MFEDSGKFLLHSRGNQYSRGWELACLLSTDQEMIPAMYTVSAHAQHFVTNDELLITVLKAFVQCTSSIHATQNASCFQSLCSIRTAAYTNNSSLVLPVGILTWSAIYMQLLTYCRNFPKQVKKGRVRHIKL